MSDPAAAPLPVLALVRDLLFASKISAAAQSLGTVARIIRDPARLELEIGRRLIVDLGLPGAIEAAAHWRQKNQGEVVGFVSHTDSATIDQARSAGLVKIVSRGQFVQMLGELLS